MGSAGHRKTDPQTLPATTTSASRRAADRGRLGRRAGSVFLFPLSFLSIDRKSQPVLRELHMS